MTKMKLCGMRRPEDIEMVNQLKPDYIGFVFAKDRKRYIDKEKANQLKMQLSSEIQSVGVFVNEQAEVVADLFLSGIIDLVQLHGQESEEYITKLRSLCDAPIIKAFSIRGMEDIEKANASSAEYVLLDSGKGGTGRSFDWSHVAQMNRPYFLAGGLGPENVAEAIASCHPYAVDVSSGIETDGWKDRNKMTVFVEAVRKGGAL